MAKTNSERSKAKRIRKKGAMATADEKQWLSEYDSDSAPIQTPEPAVDVPSNKAEEIEFPLEDFSPPSTEPIEPNKEAIQPAVSNTSPTADCGIPNCPKCAKADGRRAGQVCSVTGEVVFPPISDGTARLIAALVFVGISALVAAQTKTKKVPPPSAEELNEFAIPLKDVLYEEANFLGGYDAPMRLIAAASGYYFRAKRQAENER